MKNQRKGYMVSIEGPDGAGKSTQAKALAEWLTSHPEVEVVLTREPGGSPLAEAIRGVVLSTWDEGVDHTTELLLMFAARAAHMKATILPALERGAIVICDRFVDATWAYQGAGRGMRRSDIEALQGLVLKGFCPALTLLLDLDPAIGLERAAKRGNTNRFDEESVAFANRVAGSYRDRAALDPARYRLVDASAAEASVQLEMRRHVREFLQERGALW